MTFSSTALPMLPSLMCPRMRFDKVYHVEIARRVWLSLAELTELDGAAANVQNEFFSMSHTVRLFSYKNSLVWFKQQRWLARSLSTSAKWTGEFSSHRTRVRSVFFLLSSQRQVTQVINTKCLKRWYPLRCLIQWEWFYTTPHEWCPARCLIQCCLTQHKLGICMLRDWIVEVSTVFIWVQCTSLRSHYTHE